jgi:hypothetical protein
MASSFTRQHYTQRQANVAGRCTPRFCCASRACSGDTIPLRTKKRDSEATLAG